MTDTGTQPLWQIAEDPTLPIKDRLNRILFTAMRVLGQDVGMISQVDAQTYRLVFVTEGTPLRAGQEFPIGNSACGLVLRTGQVKSIDDTEASAYYQHPAQSIIAFRAYIGVPVYVNGGIFGTLNFAGSTRKSKFTASDREFVDKVGAMVGDVLDQWIVQCG